MSGPASILDPLRAHAERQPDRLLFAFLDVDGRTTQSYTYEAFLQRTADIASHLYDTLPLQPGERVLLVYPPGLEVICAFYACVRLGLIPVPVYPPSSHGYAAARWRMSSIAQDCGAAAVLTDRSYYWSMKVHAARTRLASLSLKRDYAARLSWIVTGDAQPHASNGVPEARSEILFLQYTSGSTSEPRGVMVTQANVLANCAAVVDHTPVAVSWLPQYHDMGLIAFYLFSPIKGGTTYGSSPLDFIQRPLLWLEAMSRHHATASAAPSFAYEYCLRPDKVADEDIERLDLGSVRNLLNGAEPVKAKVFQDFLRRFKRCGLHRDSLSAAYGLAEYTLAVTAHGREARDFDATELARDRARAPRPSARAAERRSLVSCGRPLGRTSVKIVEVGDPVREAPDGRVGEVWVSGPSRCLGYWGRPELSRRVFEAMIPGDLERRWLRTGDLGFVQDGELFVCGRAKDVIIVRGANYYPQDIEAIVEEDPAVRRGCVAAFATDDDGLGVVVVAELRNGSARPDTHQIGARVRRRLGIAIDLFVFVPKRTIPKTSSGKISRHRAHARWRDDAFEVVHRVETRAPLAGERAAGAGDGSPRSELERLFRRHGLAPDQDGTLVDAGLDSLGMVDFAVGLEKHLEDLGASDLAANIQLRWLQKISVSELFELVGQVDEAAPHAKVRFRRAFAALRREHVDTERRLMRRDAGLVVEMPAAVPAPHDTPIGAEGILLTAGTGFFGPFLLCNLLRQCEGPIHVLVRARDDEHARARLREGLASLGASHEVGLLDGWERRVVPVCGDLGRPNLGLSSAVWARLCERVLTIYHNGALVNYLLDYGGMRDTNVGSTREVIRLASTGPAKVLNHISTTFVFGWSTKETLYERDTNGDMDLLDFGYSQSKWVSEQIVLGAMERGLQGRVFRPALIAPSVRGGGYNFDIAIRLLAFMLEHGISTTAQNQVSLTPADVAAANIVAISNLADTLGQTFHVTRDEYASLVDVTRIMCELTRTEFVAHPVDEFVPMMIERCRKGDLLFPLVNFFVHSVDNITAMQFKRYDSTNYRRARDRSPFGVPDPPLQDVVAGILRFMARHGILESRGTALALERA